VHSIAWIGLLFNLFMVLALLFWPSGATGTGDWGGGSQYFGSPDSEPELDRSRETKPARQPAVATWSPAPAQVPSGFGRRGL
jgi:hypothetical protein